ncbi:galactose mutarotase [Micractinium conductrix]|uniref:Galactose mutarotase n=1 Tax=Micractinium conductrix TaxID=554055 RepID=A0A2P6V0S4_9CHLO|nr:galactose mutarotase [Micractinium conductrix]|eukprot:PSC67689.1 galactose mutarotase [Micractinium conductrix]
MGRYGGRITGGKINVDGTTYQLETGKDNNTLHGGGIGYNKVDWEVEAVSLGEQTGANASWALFTYDSPDGEQNFPGNVSLMVNYTLTDADELIVDIAAVTDAATPINVFSHPYFNLGGLTSDNDTILDHLLTGRFVLLGNGQGDLQEMDGFVAAEPRQLAATLVHPPSGRALDILTTAPTLVLYTGAVFSMHLCSWSYRTAGNALKGKFEAKYGVRPQQWAAVALEATAFPEAGNQPAFPSPILRPGEEYRNQVVWRFYDVPPAPTPTEAPASASAASLACPAVLAGGLLAALLLA